MLSLHREGHPDFVAGDDLVVFKIVGRVRSVGGCVLERILVVADKSHDTVDVLKNSKGLVLQDVVNFVEAIIAGKRKLHAIRKKRHSLLKVRHLFEVFPLYTDACA
jgi:hypothetical protein